MKSKLVCKKCEIPIFHLELTDEHSFYCQKCMKICYVSKTFNMMEAEEMVTIGKRANNTTESCQEEYERCVKLSREGKPFIVFKDVSDEYLKGKGKDLSFQSNWMVVSIKMRSDTILPISMFVHIGFADIALNIYNFTDILPEGVTCLEHVKEVCADLIGKFYLMLLNNSIPRYRNDEIVHKLDIMHDRYFFEQIDFKKLLSKDENIYSTNIEWR